MVTDEKRIDLIYAEYVRLNKRLDQLIDSSLNDFKLLSFILPVFTGVGGLIASNKIPKINIIDADTVGFIFFLTILFVVSVIAFRDFLKLSLVNYHIYTIKGYEKELSQMLGRKITKAFINIENWDKRFLPYHSKLYFSFTIVTIISLVIVPIIVLNHVSRNNNYTLYYTLISLGIFTTHVFAANSFIRYPYNKWSKELDETT